MIYYNDNAFISLGFGVGIAGALAFFGYGTIGLLLGGLAALSVDLFLMRWSNIECDRPLIDLKAGGHVWFVPAWIIGGAVAIIGVVSTFTWAFNSNPGASAVESPLIQAVLSAWEDSQAVPDVQPPADLPIANLGYYLNLQQSKQLETELQRLLDSFPNDPASNRNAVQALLDLTAARRTALQKYLDTGDRSAASDADRIKRESADLVSNLPGAPLKPAEIENIF